MSKRGNLLRSGLLILLSFALPVLLLVSFTALVSASHLNPAPAALPADSPKAIDPSSSLSQAGPQADFSASPRVGPVPLAVQFTDRSTGTVDARLWAFGDGFTATVSSPVHAYTLAGVYTVALMVWSGSISDTAVKPAYIRAGVVKPEVTFSGYTADSTDAAFNGQDELLGVAAVVGYGIYGQRIDAATGGRIGNPFALRSTSGQVDVHVAYHRAAGRYLAVWRNTSGGASDLYGQLVSATGGLIGGNFSIQGGVRRLNVAASPVTSTFMVIWTESPTLTLRARHVSTAGTLDTPLTLASGVNPDQPPAVAYQPDGAALAVWAGEDGVIRARAVLSDGTLLPAFSLSTSGAEAPAEPAVAYDAGQGRFLVVWSQGPANDREVMGC